MSQSLRDLFETHKGRVVHKFPHHIDVYDNLFAKYRAPSILEIGIAEGGSLELWRKYFGPEAVIMGIDIADRSALEGESANRVFTGDQGSPEFWNMVIPQIGRPNIIIDDGSHKCKDQIVTFTKLFPLLQDEGLYVIEDIHTSYRASYGGGLWNTDSFIEHLKGGIDLMHESEWNNPPMEDSHVFSIQFYPNLAVVHKRSPATWGGSTMRPA